MPPRPLPYAEVRRKLLALGFSEISQRGSHVKFGRPEGAGYVTVVVPRHREVAAGTLRSIIRQAHTAWEEFELL